MTLIRLGNHILILQRLFIAGLIALLFAPTPSFGQRRMMRSRRPNLGSGLQAATAGAAANGPTVPTQDPMIQLAPEGTTDNAVVQQVRQRLDKETASLNRQRQADGKDPLPEPTPKAPRAMIDMAHYGFHHVQSGPQRYLAMHVLIDNPTTEPLTIPRADISAKIDGEVKPLDDSGAGQHFSVAYGSVHHHLPNFQTPAQVNVPAQGVGGCWLVYAGLPMSSDVPKITVSVKAANRPIDVDLTESQRAVLHLDTETLGPRGCLKLVTIHGLLTSVNTQTLIETLERLAEQKVVRTIVRWSAESYVPEQQVMHWLVNSAAQMGSGQTVMEQFPSLPAQLREFHLVASPAGGFPNFEQYGQPASGSRWHRTLNEAVSAALKTAYLALPMAELMQEIEQGHPLTRAAALRHGAGRLDASHLPFLLQRLKDDDADLRTAAVRALSQFSDPSALEVLAALAKNSADPQSVAAIESLASSRYAAAHAKLLELTTQGDQDVQKHVMQVFARYPRPQWSEPIYKYVTESPHGLPIEGIRALMKVGHPQLVDLLERCLNSDDKALRELAFPVLSQRSDARSERLATDYALAELDQRPPDGAIYQFLYRTKLAAAIPKLIKHLESNQDKGQILNLLGQIGDESAGNAIAANYEKFKNHEKGTALNALHLLKHPKFRTLAGEALLSSDISQIQQATQGLMQAGDDDAVKLLIAALDKQTNDFGLNQICNALGNLGGADAKAALLKARESDQKDRQRHAITALMYLRQRSPGYQYIYQAQHHGNQKQWKEAVELFDLSLQIDPDLPEALAGRASIKQRLGQDDEAAKDFERAYELDPYNGLAISGAAIVRVQSGKLDEGLKILDRGRERYQNDPTFIYNSACVYSRAYEYFVKHEDAPDRGAKQEEFRKKAISELQLAMSRGFSDFNTLQDDPDFKPLKDDPEFKKLLGNRPAVPPMDDSDE